MNGTFEELSKFAEDPKTQDLMQLVENVCEGYQHGAVLAALVQNLVSSHIQMQSEGEGLCILCTQVSLTELLQTIRGVHDNAMLDVHATDLNEKQCDSQNNNDEETSQ